MSERHRSSRRTPVAGAVGVAVVLVLAGVLFAANARLAGGLDERQPQDLAQLVQAEQARLAELTTEVEALRDDVQRLTSDQTQDMPSGDPEQTALVQLAAGQLPVTGSGVTVRLSDASADVPRPEWVTNNDLVVHQQDLQGVINALWAGGAEAMTLAGERVVSTTAFRCVGNVLLLHGRTYSPPYEVRAIGDPADLREALWDSPAVQEYLGYVDVVGLGWSVSSQAQLELPAYQGSLELKHAQVPAGVDVLASSGTP